MTQGDSASPPHLLGLLGRYRILGVIVFFLLLAFILVYLGAKMFERYLITEAREVRAKYIAVVMEHTTHPEDFRKAKKGLQWEAFRAKMAPLLSLPEVVRVKVYNEDGELVWSDLPVLLEEPSPATKNPDLLNALAGRVGAEISHLDEKDEHRFERESFGALMELYVPLFSDPGKKAAGVVEVYLNIDPLYETIRKTQWFVAVAFLGGMGLVLCALAVGSGRVLVVMRRQNQNLQKQEAIQKLLKELSQDITVLDLGHLVKKVTEKVREVFEVDRCDIGILETEEWRTVGAGVSDLRLLRPENRSGRMKWIIENRRPLVIPDSAKGASLVYSGESAGHPESRSYLGVPVLSRGGSVIGVLRALCNGRRQFTPGEIDLIQQLAGGIAIALENAKLLKDLKEKSQALESANRDLKRLLDGQAALRDMLTQIHLLDMSDLLKQLAQQALRLLKVDHIQVRLLDKSGALRTVALAGAGAERYQERVLESGRGRSGWVIEKRQVLAIRDINEDSVFGPGHLMREMGVKGYLAVPLIARNQKCVGILLATTLQKREFDQEEIAMAQELAAGGAIAIENAMLFQETEKGRALQELLKELSQDISSLDVGHLLKKLTLKVCEFFRVDGSDVRLAEDGRWVLKASIGIDPAPYGRRRDAESPRGEYGSGWIAAKKKPLAISDVLHPGDVPAGETVKNSGFRGYLGVPIISRSSEVIGVLRALTYKPRKFTREEIDLLQQLANGAAIAIENAALFEEARRKSQELEAAYQAKSDFLNTMAHELRTPLNVIIGTEQLLADGFFGNLTEGQRKGLEPLGRSAEELLNLINGILDLARLEAGRVPLRVEEFGLGELMEELEASFTPLAREKGLGLRFEAVNGMKLRSDRSKVNEVLQNLIGNAVKYTDGGEVRVWVEAGSDGGVVISVRDTGIGMNGEELGRIFEPFYMVEGVDRRKYPGSGLGLSIVKRMVELLGGKIAVESECGKGSTFKVVLPSLS